MTADPVTLAAIVQRRLLRDPPDIPLAPHIWHPLDRIHIALVSQSDASTTQQGKHMTSTRRDPPLTATSSLERTGA